IYKRLFWRAAALTIKQDFTRYMEHIRQLDPEAYSFNAQIIDTRGTPIIFMLEDIRVYIMQRNWSMSKLAATLNDNITLSIRNGEFYLVDIRLWSLSGVPCVHALAAFLHFKLNPYDGVSSWVKLGVKKVAKRGAAKSNSTHSSMNTKEYELKRDEEAARQVMHEEMEAEERRMLVAEEKQREYQYNLEME
ncbi:hypothetical protein Tco_1140084, partial [Tanacetum coccineum]